MDVLEQVECGGGVGQQIGSIASIASKFVLQNVPFVTIMATFEEEVVYHLDGVVVTARAEWCISAFDSMKKFVEADTACAQLKDDGSLRAR